MKKIISFTRSIKLFVLAHKVTSIVIALVLVIGGYKGYGALTSTAGETQYTVSRVSRSTIVTSVSGTGQVSSSNQVSIKPKVGGTVVSVKATDGQVMKSGDIILSIDATDAYKSIRDAEANLASAELSLQKLTKAADTLSLLKSENALTQAKQSKEDAITNLAKAYDDGFTSISNAFLNLPGTVSGMNDILNGTQVSSFGQFNVGAYYEIIKSYQTNPDQLRDSAVTSFNLAKAAYDENLQDYKNVTRASDRGTVEALISQTYQTTRLLSDATKNIKNFLDAVHDTEVNYLHVRTLPATLVTHESNIQSYTGTTNGHLQTLLSIKNTISDTKNSITNATLSIEEKIQSLADLKSGADPLDVKSQEISIQQRKNALLDAQEALADYTVRAPFDGVVSGITVKKGDETSAGTAIASFLTKQKYAEITLNEVDAVNVKVGQKATATFDAIPNLSVSGQVMSVDSLGTVSQGVVTYAIKIVFDTQDERIKSGMSVNVSIVTDVRTDILVVPASAVKTATDGSSYLEVFSELPAGATVSQTFVSATAPQAQNVTVGVSNDTDTEVATGISEGAYVVTRTVVSTGTTSVAAPSASSLLGGTRSGAGAARSVGR